MGGRWGAGDPGKAGRPGTIEANVNSHGGDQLYVAFSIIWALKTAAAGIVARRGQKPRTGPACAAVN